MRSDFTPDLRVRRHSEGRSDETLDEGSSVGYARSLHATARVASVTATATYRSVGADYRALAAQWLAADRREVGVTAALGHAGWNMEVEAFQQSDNVSQDGAFTTVLSKLGARLALPQLKDWSANLLVEHRTRTNESTSPDQRIDERTWLLRTDHRIGVSHQGVVRSALLGYEFQTTGDGNPLRMDSRSDSHTLHGEVLTSLTERLQVTPSFRLVASAAAAAPRAVIRVYAMAIRQSVRGDRLGLGLDVRREEHPDAAWWAMAVTSRLRLGGDLGG
jgi:hypothetical protein